MLDLSLCFYYLLSMFVRVKSTPYSPRKYVQIVQSVRKGDKVTQKIVRHIGVAMDDNELSQLKLLAESLRNKLESGAQELLFSPECLAGMNEEIKTTPVKESDKDYNVNLLRSS